ncbi:HNH endonuclease [Neobacillus sp. 204]|uniref:HNH endonuclease n=1 Tax=Neobacillus sp. 204 TaxID=3383351 RepID=UPI00397AB624
MNSDMFVCLSKNGKIKMMRVHRLVASTFIPNPENKPEVNHKNGVKSDNEVSNLEWNTRIENVRHSYETGLKKALKGEENNNSKLTESDVMYIRKNYTPRHPKFNTVAFSKKFGVHNTVISSIVTFKTWRHVQGPIKIKPMQLSLFD